MDQDYIELKNWLDSTAGEPLEDMEAFFQARIAGYEEHMAHWDKHYKWISELLPGNIETLLDLGCGTGLELDTILARFPELNVTGIDLSSEMLAELRRKHREHSLTLVQADYFLYDLGENCFDAAVSVESLHHFTAQKKTSLFSKIYRCLKPGGVYLECDYIAVTQAIEDLTFSECRRRRLRDGILPDSYVHFDTPLTLEHEMSAMKAAGFKTVELVGYLPHDNHTPVIRAMK